MSARPDRSGATPATGRGGQTACPKLIRIAHLLDAPTLAALQAALADPALFVDGRRTAGWHARPVKRNLQARRGGVVDQALAQIEAALLANEVFVAAARPKAILRLLISRYEPGMTYGTHVDDALMGGVRTDLSFTLFLADPESYQGGALVIDDTYGEREVKLPAGELFLYPSTTLHRVAPVMLGRAPRRGRLGAQLRARQRRREILFDLETALRACTRRTASRPCSTSWRRRGPICCACGPRTSSGFRPAAAGEHLRPFGRSLHVVTGRLPALAAASDLRFAVRLDCARSFRVPALAPREIDAARRDHPAAEPDPEPGNLAERDERDQRDDRQAQVVERRHEAGIRGGDARLVDLARVDRPWAPIVAPRPLRGPL